MRRLTIEFTDNGEMNVIAEDGRNTGFLTIGEAIEQIVFMKFEGKEKYLMLSSEQWANRFKSQEQPE